MNFLDYLLSTIKQRVDEFAKSPLGALGFSQLMDAYRSGEALGGPALGAAAGTASTLLQIPQALALSNKYIARPLSQTAYGGISELRGVPGIKPDAVDPASLVGNLGLGLVIGLARGGLTDAATRRRYEQQYENAPFLTRFAGETLYDPATYLLSPVKGLGEG